MLFPYSEVKLKQIFRWTHRNHDWPIQTIEEVDKDGYFITRNHIGPGDEFMILDKFFDDYRNFIRIIILGKEIIGWLVCGNGVYPMEKVL